MTYTIPAELQQRVHNQSMFKVDFAAELEKHFTQCDTQAEVIKATTQNEQIISQIETALDTYKKKYYALYIRQLNHKANNPSWAVTGRAGLNTTRYNNRMSQYEKMVHESAELTNWINSQFQKAQREIKLDHQAQQRETMNAITETVEFKTESKTITMHRLTEKVRCYIAGEYMICKTWGTFRIFKNGKEVHAMKTAEKLTDAKKYVTMLIQQEVTA